ncbi:MAG TPA: hypothetical protein VFI61_04560 [Patescibacteria group bacterium]|nr:hypothetical protein [Patescibacteria group bacterium]
MSIWKGKVALFKQQQQAIATNQKDVEGVKLAEEQKALLEKAKNEYEAKVRALGNTFHCQCCGKPATKPFVKVRQIEHGMHDNTYTETVYSDDWTRPGDLFECKQCNELTCADCLEDSICKFDWGKLIGQPL